MKILYLHGIGSGAESRTPVELRKDFHDIEILAPELPVSPKAAYEFLKKNYWDDDDIGLIIGTSLGGFYALSMIGALTKKLLINPAMFADEDIGNGIGLGKQPFFTKRSDGAEEYTIDEQFISELAEIRREIYKNRDPLYPEKMEHNMINETYALFGEKDSLLSHYDDFCKLFCEDNAEKFDGEHRLSVDEIHNVLAPFVRRILEEESLPICFVCDDL
ncbi:MAG: YqiA/YcfP family alpha/beta fold hydrolase [Oscillospiraceae bacterium]